MRTLLALAGALPLGLLGFVMLAAPAPLPLAAATAVTFVIVGGVCYVMGASRRGDLEVVRGEPAAAYTVVPGRAVRELEER